MKNRFAALLILLSALLSICYNGYANTLDVSSIELDSPQSLEGKLYYASIADCPDFEANTIDSCSALRTLVKHPLSLGFKNEPHWFAFSLVNSSDMPSTIYLDVGYSLLDNIKVFVLDQNGAPLYEYVSGDALPFSERPIKHPDFIFPIDIPQGERVDVRMYIDTESSMQVPILIWDPEHFTGSSLGEFMLYGFLIGAMLIMATYHFVMWFSTSDKSYFFCATTLFLYALVQSDLLGLSYALLWPNNPIWNQVSLVVFDVMAVASVAIFSQTFMQMQTKNHLTDRLLRTGVMLCLALLLFVPFLPYFYLIVGTTFLVAAIPLVAFIKSFILWRKGFVAARYFLFAFLFFVVAVFVFLASKYGVVPRTGFTEYTIHFGALVVVVCLSLAIADQINHDNEKREKAQTESIDSLMKYEEIYTKSNEGLFRIDNFGHFVNVNPSFLAILGAESLDKLKQKFSDLESILVHDRSNVLEKILSQDNIVNLDVLCHKTDNSHVWVSLNTRAKRRANRIQYIEGSMIDISERKGIERRLSYLANYDQLTGLVNRNAFRENLANILEHASMNQSEHALLYLDLDRFKLVNDTCGHMAGDELLKQLGMLFTSQVRQDDTFARIGGDEFAVLLVDCDLAKAKEIANQLKSVLNKFNFTWENKTFDIGASIGIVKVDKYSHDVVSVMNLADTACLKAKEQGRNQIVCYEEDNKGIHEKLLAENLIKTIHNAIKKDDFIIYRQQISSVSAPEKVIYELLVRLDLGDEIVGPDTFLPTAERYNLMPKIDQWVIKECLYLAENKLINLEQIDMITINLSGQTLSNHEFISELYTMLKEHTKICSKICFEITESSALGSLLQSSTAIEKLKNLGIKFAIDDFGSGYASYSYLTELPVDFVKIDGSFCINVDRNPINRAIVKSIVDIAHTMELEVIAEYVETSGAMICLKEIGVDMLQGYYLDKPSTFCEYRKIEHA